MLEGFAKAQEPDVALLVDDGADAVRSLVRDGLQVTQDRFNRTRSADLGAYPSSGHPPRHPG